MTRPINDLRNDLAHYAQELDKRRESGVLPMVVTALNEARRQLQRLTPQWRPMPTVEEVTARHGKRWLCKSPEYGVDIVSLIVKGDAVGVSFPEIGIDVPAFPDRASGGWWPCGDDGIREASWPTVQADDAKE